MRISDDTVKLATSAFLGGGFSLGSPAVVPTHYA